MTETGISTTSNIPDANSSGVEALIARLRLQGVEAGHAARAEIIAGAEREAEALIKEAREKASGIVDDAVNKAARLRASGEDALRVAMRDTVLRMRETLQQRLESQVKRLAAQQLNDERFLRQLIVEVAARARSDAGVGDAEDIEVLLPPQILGLEELQRRPEEMETKLGQFASEIAAATLREGISIDALEPGARGIRIRLKDHELELDLTDGAIADLLLKHLQPRFRIIMESIVW